MDANALPDTPITDRAMTDDAPQLYLVTPPHLELETFPDMLARVLDAAPVACLRLDLATRDEDTLIRSADMLRAVTEPRDIAVVLRDHVELAQRAGLDGVHLPDGSKSVRWARKILGGDAVVGAFCGTSRHDGMNAGEGGADYVAFGPLGGAAPADGALAELELFEWWSEIVEVPVIAEGSLDEECIASLSDTTDFISLGEEIWAAQDPAARLVQLAALF